MRDQMGDRDELDLLLDSALATYADPGPESGLERRVLAVLAAERESGVIRNAAPRPRRWLVWAIAAPLAASLLLWVSMARISHSPSTPTRQAHESNRVPSMSAPRGTARADSHQGIHPSGAKAHRDDRQMMARLKSCPVTEPACDLPANVARAAPLPKLDVFPTPKPLTAEERALFVVAVEAPPQVRQALVEAQEQNNEPLRIAAIHIPPLEPLSESQP